MASVSYNEGQDGSSGPGCSQKMYGNEKYKINIVINKENKSVEKCMSHFKLCHIKQYPKTLEKELKQKKLDFSSFEEELSLISRIHQPHKKVVEVVNAVLDDLEKSLVFKHYQIRGGSGRLLQTIRESEGLKGVEVSCEEYGDNGVVVCKKTDETSVFETVDKIAGNLCKGDDSSQNKSSRNDSFEHISSEEASSTVEYDKSLLSKGKDVPMELATEMEKASCDIPLTSELLDFVQQNEPQQFIISEMRKIGMRCQVIQQDKGLRLEKVDKDANFENAEHLLHDLTHMEKIPDSHLLNQLFQLKDISKVLTQNENIAGKIKVFEKEKNFCILMTRDVRSKVEYYFQNQLRVEAKMFHCAEDVISNLTDQDTRELDEMCRKSSDGKVIYKMVQEKGNCGIFVCGTFDAFHSFREKLAQLLDRKKGRIKADWLRLDGKKEHLKLESYMKDLLQHYPCALEHVLVQAKCLHITLHWDDSHRSLCLAGGEEDHISQIQNMLPKWIIKKVILLERQFETGESFLEDVRTHLMRDEKLHQNKVFFTAESRGIILVGTDDVIENAFKLVEEYIISLREKRSVSISVPGSTLQSNSEAPEAPSRKRRKVQGQAADTPEFQMTLTEMQKRLLQEKGSAQESLFYHFQKQEFLLHFDLERSIVIFEVRNSIDQMIIKDAWQKVFVTRDLDMENEQILISPDLIKSKLRQQFNDLNKRVLIVTDKISFHLIGLIGPAQPVVECLEEIINDYKRYTMTLSVKDVSMVRSHNADIRKIEKMDKESLSRVQLQDGEIILTCPSSHYQKMKHTLLEFLDRITSNKALSICEVTLPSCIELALKRKRNLTTFVEDRFRLKRWVIDISKKIVFSSLFYIDFEDQEEELKSLFITKTMDLTTCLYKPDEVISKLANYGCEFEICYRSDNQVKLVCINDSSQKLDDAFQRIIHEFECTNIDRKRVKCDHVSSPDELTTQLWEIEPELQNKAKVVILNGHLRLVYFAEMSSLALETFEQLCLQLEMRDINKENPSSKVKLTSLHVCLLQNPNVMHYVHQKVRSEHFQLSCDLNSGELSVFALTAEDAECGRMVVESCFKSHIINLKNHQILENLALSDVVDMIQVQHAVHGSKIQFSVREEEKQIMFLCTDDVNEGVLKKVDQILKQCSRSEHIVEVQSMQVAEFINRFKLKVDFSQNNPQVEVILCKDGQNAIFELTGKGDLSTAVQTLSSLCDTVKLKEFPLDESEYTFLITHPGKTLIAKVENSCKCVVSVYKSKSHMLGLEERQNNMTENPFGDQRDENFSTEDLSTGVHLLDLNPSHADSDVVAVAFVNGELSIEVEAFLKYKSQYEEWKKISSQLLRKQRENTKTKELQSSCAFSSAGNQNPRFAFILLPGGETEADKEKRKSCIGTFLQGCLDLQAASVGLVVDVPDDAIKKVGKQIVHSSLDYSHLQINIFCQREQKQVLEKHLKDAESHIGKIKKMMKTNKTKKGLKESSKLEKQICLEVDELSRVKADVLVNSVNKDLDLSNGRVAKSLNNATKGQLQAALKKTYPNGIHEGKLAITDSCGLKSKKIFHGNLKSFQPENKSKNKKKDYFQSRWELMKVFIHRCLHEARSHRYQSVAFPVLGCGTLGYPPDEVVHVMFNSVEQFFEEYGQSSVCKVIFVLYPKDKEIIKIFHEGWMAHNLGINLNVHPETSITVGRVVLQIFCKDIWNSRGESDGLLCFWNENQFKDPSKHPIVGEDLEGIKWELYARDLKQKMCISTMGGNLPAKYLYHMRSGGQSFEQDLMETLKHASQSGCFSLQIPIVDEVSLPWVDFAKTLWKVLQHTDIAEGNLTVVALLTKEREIFKTLLENFQQLNKGTNLSNFPINLGVGACNWVSSKLFPSSGPLVAIAALSEASCKKALSDLKSEMKKEGSSVDNPSGITDAPWKVCSDSNSAMSLSNVFLEHPKWKKTKAEISKLGIEATEEKNSLIFKGPFEKLSEGVLVIRDMCKIVPNKTLDKNDIADLSPGKAIVVSEDHFMAVEHLIGKQEIEKCFIVKDKPPSEKQIFFKDFLHDEDKKAEAENIEQRIKGVIQEEVQFSETERKRAEEKVATMAKNSDMFLIYKPDRNVIVIFTEDWQKMSDAKKKVQSKATSREGRRFASQPKPGTNENERPTSTSSSKVKDTDCFRGKTITVRVYKADITKLEVDVIVNAANGRLSHGGGVAKAIADAAGPSLTREGNALVDKFGQIAVTDLAVTKAGNLPCKKVFHAVGPQWPTGTTTKQNQCQTDLCLTILRCLCEAENMKMRSIAIPSISAAIFRVPKNLCARAYVRALKIFDEISGASHLEEVHFIDISDTMVEEILAACGATWNIPVDVSQYDTEREFMNIYLGNTKKSSSKVSKSSEPTDTLSLVDFFSGHPFTKPADAIVSWENSFGSYQSTISFFLKDGGKDFEEGRRKALDKCLTSGDVEIGPGGHLPVKHVVYTKVPTAVRSNELLDYLRKILNKTASSDSLVIPVLKDLDKQGIGKNWKTTFVECLVQALQEYSKSNPGRRKILIFAENSTDMQDVQTHFKERFNALSLKQLKEDCSICLEAIAKPSKLKCGHVFCEGCINDAFKVKQACPICKTVCGVITGNMPYGKMDVNHYGPQLPGFEKYKTITIHYNFPDGTQSSDHPHPGEPYRGTRRTAFLPASPEGYEILKLLKVAWDRKLTFTVGRSVTIDDEMDRVTWNEIHHKTKATGGETNHGYPDPGYLKRVKEELAAQGVTLDDLGATGTHV